MPVKTPYEPLQLPLQGLQWERLVAAVGRANRAIARYQGILQAIPNASVLLSPLTTNEAVLSSKIEGTQATLGEVLRFEAGDEPLEERKKFDIQEVLNYRRALRIAEKSIDERPFSLSLLRELHAVLMNSVRGQDKKPGAFRTTQNWIGLPNTPIEEAFFVPPSPIHLPQHLGEWERYYQGEEPDPLVQLAVVHAQFEIIHPFDDGNGRLGRMLIPLFLFERKVLSKPTFYLSAYLEGNRDEYVSRLRAIDGREGWEDWILFFLRAIEQQSIENTAKAHNVLDLYKELKGEVLKLTRSQFAIPVLDFIFEFPIFSSSMLMRQKGMPSRQMVSNILREMKNAHLLASIQEGGGRRAEVLAFRKLLNVCEGREAF